MEKTKKKLPPYIKSNAATYQKIADDFYNHTAKAKTAEEYQQELEKVSREKGSRWSKRFQIGDHVEYLADNLYSACGTITAIDQEKIVILVEAETVTTAYECCLHDFDEDREDTISWIDIDAISLAEKTERLHCNFNLNEFEVGDAVELSINGQSYKGTIVALHKPFFCVKFDDETTQRFIKWGVDNLKKIAPTKCE